MTSSIVLKHWEDGSILISSKESDCFLYKTVLNPMINWLNLHQRDLEYGIPCDGGNSEEDIKYLSSGGNLFITTHRDYIFLTKPNLVVFVDWLNKNRKVLNIKEVWPRPTNS
jgi:hypothetical protein